GESQRRDAGITTPCCQDAQTQHHEQSLLAEDAVDAVHEVVRVDETDQYRDEREQYPPERGIACHPGRQRGEPDQQCGAGVHEQPWHHRQRRVVVTPADQRDAEYGSRDRGGLRPRQRTIEETPRHHARRRDRGNDADPAAARRRLRMRAPLAGLVQQTATPRIGQRRAGEREREQQRATRNDRQRNDDRGAVRDTHRYSETTLWIGRTVPQLLQLGHCQWCALAPKPQWLQRYMARPSSSLWVRSRRI